MEILSDRFNNTLPDCIKRLQTAVCPALVLQPTSLCATQGHVFSLGSTLSAALSFVAEPELGVELGEEIQKLLEQMQEKKPEDRPLLQVTKQPLLLFLLEIYFDSCRKKENKERF